jgi:hypothetical protein
MSGMPTLVCEPAPCPQCGATTAIEAEIKCTATQNQSGDYECAGNDCEEDATGRFMFPTAASIAALDAWFHQQGMRDDAEEDRRNDRTSG